MDVNAKIWRRRRQLQRANRWLIDLEKRTPWRYGAMVATIAIGFAVAIHLVLRALDRIGGGQ